MKVIGQLMTMLALLLFTLSQSVTAQTTHTIRLNVNTGMIDNSNVNSACNFGQDPSIANRDFTITVKNGDIVVWVGVSDSSDGRVEVTAINHEGGARVFGKNKLNGNDGVVTGVVTDGRPGDEEKYKISFKVFDSDVRKGTFHIDPKIKVD